MKYIVIAVVAVALMSCQSENPFISEELAKKIIEANKIKPVEHVAFIVNNDVYIANNFDQDPKKITNTASVVKKQIRFSHDHTKIAYLNSNGSPVIIDTLGAIKAQLTSFSNVKQMDWSADDQTLYMLIGNEIKFYGVTMNLPAMPTQAGEEIISAIITADRAVVYMVQTPTGLGKYTQRVEKRTVAGGSTTINKQSGEIRAMKTLRLSKDGDHFIVGYSASQYDGYLVKMEVYQKDGVYPALTYETSQYIDPVYDHVSRFIVTATRYNSFDPFYVAALYTMNEPMEESNDKEKFNYKAVEGSIFVDWK